MLFNKGKKVNDEHDHEDDEEDSLIIDDTNEFCSR
jgi:hypothetical protein